MKKNKTTVTALSVADHLASLSNATQIADSQRLIELLSEQTGCTAKMWGGGMVGFGSYYYRYESGHEGEAPLIAFALRATATVLYVSGQLEQREALLAGLGKHKTEKNCIYIKKLSDIDFSILAQLTAAHIAYIQGLYQS